jgi:hypothetical protein
MKETGEGVRGYGGGGVSLADRSLSFSHSFCLLTSVTSLYSNSNNWTMILGSYSVIPIEAMRRDMIYGGGGETNGV